MFTLNKTKQSTVSAVKVNFFKITDRKLERVTRKLAYMFGLDPKLAVDLGHCNLEITYNGTTHFYEQLAGEYVKRTVQGRLSWEHLDHYTESLIFEFTNEPVHLERLNRLLFVLNSVAETRCIEFQKGKSFFDELGRVLEGSQTNFLDVPAIYNPVLEEPLKVSDNSLEFALPVTCTAPVLQFTQRVLGIEPEMASLLSLSVFLDLIAFVE